MLIDDKVGIKTANPEISCGQVVTKEKLFTVLKDLLALTYEAWNEFLENFFDGFVFFRSVSLEMWLVNLT